MGIQRLEVRGDSNLTISQVNGEFDAKDPKMMAYQKAILKLSAWLDGLEFHHVARESNQAADTLARMGAKHDPVPPNIFVERLFKPYMVWQGENREGNVDLITPPTAEHNADNVGSPDIEITPSAHEIMAVIAP